MAETGNELSVATYLWLLHWLVSLSQVLQNLMGGRKRRRIEEASYMA